MTQSFLDMMYLFSCGARGVMPTLDHKIDFKEIYKHAHSQGVWPTTFLALKKLYDNNELDIDKSLFKKLQDDIMYQSIQQIKRLDFIHKMIKELEDNGIECCVLKGEVLAQLYHEPLLRPSSDTDILIDKSNVKKVTKILKKMGFEVYPKHKNSHHVQAKHPLAGMIELHTQLYDEIFEDVWFDKKMGNEEDFLNLQTSKTGIVKTLGVTDGLLFTYLHFIKHFLAKGVGIRQLMDIVLYTKNYRETIDWNKFNGLMNYLKYNRFMEYIIEIGIRYLNFDSKISLNYTLNEKTVDGLLEDIALGGILGKQQEMRGCFYLLYTKERYKRFKTGSYEEYIKGWDSLNYFKVLFPDKYILMDKYPYVINTHLLIPVAWMHRFFNFTIKLIKKQTKLSNFDPTTAPDNEIVIKRINLVRELDMI